MKRKLITDNPNEALRILLQHFGLKYNRHAEAKYKSYPLYPGFNAFSYIMAYNGIDTCLVKTTKEELQELPMPILINYDGLFLPISACRTRLLTWTVCARRLMCRTSANGLRSFRLDTTPRSELTATGSAPSATRTISSFWTTAGLRRRGHTSISQQKKESTMNWSGTSWNLEIENQEIQ